MSEFSLILVLQKENTKDVCLSGKCIERYAVGNQSLDFRIGGRTGFCIVCPQQNRHNVDP